MICHYCYKYGHTKTRCRQAQVCRKCGRTDHSIDKCENNSMCPNCDVDHNAGRRECGAEQKERKIKEVQTKEKVGRTPANKSTKFRTHFSCKMNPGKKRNSVHGWSKNASNKNSVTNHEPLDRKVNPNSSLKSIMKPKVKPSHPSKSSTTSMFE